MFNKFRFTVILLGLVMFAGISAEAAVYTVDKTDDSLTVQNCTAAPNDCSLRSALFLANRSSADDTINFDPAIFNVQREIQLTTSDQFIITNNGALTISGPGAKLLSINGLNTVRVFNITAGSNASISGLTIRNGSAGGGGGIRNGGNLTVNSCEIKFNTGGQFTEYSSGGGGILNEGNLNLINSTVYGNTATPTSTYSSSYGGGIYNSGGGTTNIINSTISGNKSTAESNARAGGIWNDGQISVSPTINLINSTIAFNIAEATGSSSDCRGGGVNNNGGIVNARNTIIAGNGFNCGSFAFGPDYYNKLNSQGYNLIGIQTCSTFGYCYPDIVGDTTGNIVNVNAQLAPLADNGGQTLTHALLSNSPAINAGSNAKAVDQNNNPLTTDQRGTGFPRINNNTVDMGAYETLLIPADTTTTITADTPDPSNVGQSVTVSYTVTAAAGTPTGNVTVSDGVNSCVGTVAAGQCSLTLTTAGNRTLTASYSGDANFNPSISAGEPHTVNPNAPLVLVVDNTTDNGALSACTNAANDCSLRGAISRANAVSTNDTINFSASVFNVARTIIVSNGELAVTDNGGLTINGTGANLLNISGGGGANRVFNFSTTSVVVLNNLTVSGGNASDGGGILANPTSVTLNFCNISGNNVTGFGGGIYNINGTLNINSSLVSGNTAGGSGGGIANGGSPSVLNVSNSTISGNTSGGTGGGGIFTNGQVTIYNSTIANNTANGDGTNTGIGGGISNFATEAVSLGNTIVAGNNAPNSPDFRGFLTSLGFNLIGNTGGTGIVGNTDGNKLDVNPLLGSLGNNGGATQTHRLLSGSPAINAGNNFLAVDATGFQQLTTDQRGTGFNRIVGATVDIGALENNLPVVTQNPQSQTVPVGSSVTFTARAGVFSETAPSSLASGEALLPGQFLISPNYGYKFVYQGDGNLVLYRGDGVVLWNSGTFGTSPGQAVMQTDGNFVIYDSNSNVLFSTGTFGNPGSTLNLQSDGNVVIYSSGGTPLYNTGTSSGYPIPTVQWQVSTDNGANFTDISGATTPILTFTAQLSDSGNLYRAVFTNTYGSVTSSAATLTVNKADTTTTIIGDSPDPSQQGESFTVSYSVVVVAPGTGTPTGNVTVSDGVNNCTGTVAAGQCSLTLNTVGNYTLTATYSGDVNYNGSISAGEQHTVIGFVVDNTSDDGNLSACTATANDCSLRGAINRANAAPTDDAINFDSGIFSTAQTIILTNGELLVVSNGGLTINGTGANRLTVSGNMTSRVFNLSTSFPVVLNGLTITGGNSDGGGGILANPAPVTINNCNISENNTSGNGGGIYNIGNTMNINASTISGNTASGAGGGIANGSNPSLLNIINSTISGNTSNGSGGGGIFLSGGMTLKSSTVTTNRANGDGVNTGIGGGISNFTSDPVILGNTIVARNLATTAPDFRDTLTSLGYNLIEDTDGTIITGDTTGNILNQSAVLAPLSDFGGTTKTHALLPRSPAINAGNPSDFPPTDQRGFDRPANGNSSAENSNTEADLALLPLPDIGAFEVLTPTAAGISVSGKVSSPNGRGVSNAIVHITDQNGNIRTARTNPFGYYRFEDIEVGQTLIFNVYSKSYQYDTRVINIDDNLTNLDFIPQVNRSRKER